MNKVSIIMPSYNAAKFIAASIQSVIDQTYCNWELLITDDCSKDDTVKIVEQFLEKDNRIFVIRPTKHIKIKHMETNKDKIQAMYDLGVEDTKKKLNDLKKYLEE